MKRIIFFGLILCVTFDAYCQAISFVKDSIMNYYMESGFSNKNFRSKGEWDKKTDIRYGKWIDYEVAKTFAYISDNEGNPKQIFGQYLIYGEGNFVDSKREGKWELYLIEDKSFKNILQRKVNYKNGLMEGEFTHFYPSGKVGIEGLYSNEKLDGLIKSYYENGKPNGLRYYAKGLAIGKHTYFYPNGQIRLEAEFVNDTLNGSYKSFYENGQIKENFIYKKGKEDGIYKYYYPNGQLWIEKEYKEGRVMNVINNYDSEGKAREKGTLKEGNGTIILYTEKGEIYSIVTYKDGKKIDKEYKMKEPKW